MSRSCAGATLALCLFAVGCGASSEREAPTCRNAWRKVVVPQELKNFQAWATAWHEERLYLFKSEPKDGVDHYPEGPVGLVFEPPDRFRPISAEGRTPLVWVNAALPIGREIVVTAEPSYLPDLDGRVFGSRYDTVADSWTPLPILGGESLSELAVSPMGDELFAVQYESPNPAGMAAPAYLAWAPATGWRALSSPLEPGIWVHGAWTGREVIVWGNADSYDVFEAPAAARYDPDADRWQAVSTLGAPTLTENVNAAWTGVELVTEHGRYYPDRDAWEPVSEDGAVSGTPFAVGRRVLFWSMSVDAQGAVYDAETDRWGEPTTTHCLDQSGTGRVVAWIDHGLFVWDSLDRAWYLPAEAAFGDLPDDASNCSCPPTLGK